MTDLEMTKLCAEAMGWRVAGKRKDFDIVKAIPVEQFPGAPYYQYAPIKNDAQAMALVKRFRLQIDPHDEQWNVGAGEGSGAAALCEDLNRAIVECVANIHKAREYSQSPEE